MEINSLEVFKKTVASGRTALGCVIQTPDATVTEVAAASGFDFVWIDMEHGVNMPEDVLNHIRAVRGTKCAPFVRVPSNEPWLVKTVIDFVPAGVIFPMVNTPEDARAAIAACRYPMEGGERGFGVRRGTAYGARPLAEYLADSRRGDPMVILQIEHRKAVENLDAILAVPGWDSVCVGPCDLSASYGRPMQFHAPEVSAALAEVFRKVSASDKMLGGFFPKECLPLSEGHISWRALLGDYETLEAAWRSMIAGAEKTGK